MAGFDIQGALKAGYSSSEILQHLDSQKDSNFDIRGALNSGYSPDEVLTHITGGDAAQPDKSYLSTLKQGISNVIGGIGETKAQTVGGGDSLKSTAQSIAPGPGFQEPKVVDQNGVHLGELPRAVVESAPGMAASIMAAKLMPGGLLPKALAGGLMYAGQTFGNKVLARAKANDHAEPTTGDRLAAAAGEIPDVGLGAVGVGRFLPGVGKAVGVGTQGIMSAGKQLAKTALTEGLTSAGQNAVSQATTTLGTKKGLTVDPSEVENAGLVGGAAGAAFGAPKAIHDVNDAIKYRSMGGNMAAPAASVANDIATNAPGSLTPGLFSRTKQGFAAVSRSEALNQAKLGEQIDALKQAGPVPPEVSTALSRAQAGQSMNEQDHAAIAQGTQGAPNSDLLQFLARKAAVYPFLKKQGAYSTANQTFAGGASGRLLTAAREHMGKTALAAMFGAGEGSHLIAFSPEMLATMAAGGAGARVLDTMTGNINPANRFMQKFANSAVQAPGVQAVAPPPPPDQTRNQIKETGDLMAARRANAAVLSRQALPLLARLAHSPAASALPVIAGAVGGHFMGPLGEHLAGGTAHEALEAYRNANPLQAPGAAPAAPAAPVPTTVPPQIIAQTKRIVQGLQNTQKLKQRTLGQNQADEVASGSPLIDRVGGPAAIANPEAGKRMGQMVSAAKALQALNQDLGTLPGRVNGAAQTVTGAPAPEKVTKANGNIGVDNEPFPASSFASLPSHEAARHITDAAVKANTVKYPSGFRASTQRRIDGQRMAMSLVGRDVPGLPIADMTARLEGVPDQKTARAFRDSMKLQYPQAARQLDQYLSDDVIKGLWTRKG